MMQKFYPLLGLVLALVLPTAHAQTTPAWNGAAQTLNPTPTDDTRAFGRTIAADAAGNAYVGGSLSTDQARANPLPAHSALPPSPARAIATAVGSLPSFRRASSGSGPRG
ncbi:hypothetical protein [Hymenobacter rubripertinctus]|uniref:hypothetical protein n=1 Tax=Hymenobacter rubripertinctus TaxID=2029981 RepID=UPI0016045627|nr:hypothetical protein [Hymenobacter rubripertinctus]